MNRSGSCLCCGKILYCELEMRGLDEIRYSFKKLLIIFRKLIRSFIKNCFLIEFYLGLYIKGFIIFKF